MKEKYSLVLDMLIEAGGQLMRIPDYNEDVYQAIQKAIDEIEYMEENENENN